ncbi:hypothetical protein BAUCODRAFT_21871 [Baudoinia panamericana UAMH 10762]|uniref:Uncharacterized protein n=1 Tax=Baudoinia panamericana (strain UAMH 10762) TaxID=717646 RepID=M2LZT9_BAUPA|nr:uncharacterized protein BAUCODRAFT_21871 [Baudoinia panamericana UAMH 10762]EMD00233.1 hypothetical protein BAUCODRAFT_21871 [Baudoinia panamericana UAMH 10762]
MAGAYNIEELREQVARDTEIFKAEKARFYRLQDMASADITETDRNAIINWSRASISDYSSELERMELKATPTKEEKEVMRVLNQLIMLGDQIAEFMSHFVAEYEAKFGRTGTDSATLPEGAVVRPDGKTMVPKTIRNAAETTAPLLEEIPITASHTLSAASQRLIQPEMSANPSIVVQPPSQFASPPSAPDVVHPERLPKVVTAGTDPKEASDHDAESENVVEESIEPVDILNMDNDPKGIYKILGLAPDATMVEVKKQVDCNNVPSF